MFCWDGLTICKGVSKLLKTVQSSIYWALKNYSNRRAAEVGKAYFTYSDVEKNAHRLLAMLNEFEKKEFPCYILLFSERINYLVSIISVLFNRGIFVPVDIMFPEGKIIQIIQQSHADYIISDCNYAKKLSQEVDLRLIQFKAETSCEDVGLDYNNNFNENDPIYIYFTSGTTLKPKGVLGRNSGLQHFIEWERTKFTIHTNSRFAQLTSPSFDPFLRDYWCH